jgi:V-type H+-transporting ATPase subunit C
MEGKHYWLICVPKKASKGDVFEDLCREVRDVVTEIHKFNIPELKVGTLDMLMQLSDDLNKMDFYVEQVVRKIAKQYFDVVEKKPEKFNIPVFDGEFANNFFILCYDSIRIG